jgi:hypothetical protein
LAISRPSNTGAISSAGRYAAMTFAQALVCAAQVVQNMFVNVLR